MHALRTILLILVLGAATSSVAAGQIFDEDIRLSSLHTVPWITTYALIQASAVNDELEIVVWGSSMPADTLPYPVLYFAIVDDSTIVVPPTRLTGLESRPGSTYDAFIRITPLTDRWLVSWIDGRYGEDETHAVVVGMDGSFGEPFALWKGRRITEHGVSAVRMQTADILCWSYSIGTGAHRVVAKKLPHNALRPDSAETILGNGFLILTRDYFEAVDAGLIEFSIGGPNRFVLIREDLTTAEFRAIPALSSGYDVFSINEDYSLYLAHGDTIKHFQSILDSVPTVTNRIEVESIWESRPITWIGINSGGDLVASTFEFDVALPGISQSYYRTYEKTWQLDTALRVIGEERKHVGSSGVSLPMEVDTELGPQTSEIERMTDNTSLRYLRIIEPRQEEWQSDKHHLVPLITNRFGGYPVGSFKLSENNVSILNGPYNIVPASTVVRMTSDLSIVYPRSNPRLHLKAGSMTREHTGDERTPHLTILGDRIFASWLNHMHPPARHTVEILRDGTGSVTLGEEHVDRDTAGGRPDILGHSLISVGPNTISELHWRVGERTYRELSLLREEDGEVDWRPIYQESYTGDTGVSTTERYYSESFYDPDEQRAWIMSERYYYDHWNAPSQVSTRALRISPAGIVMDTLDLYVPLDTNGRPYQSRLVKYYPIDSVSYLVKTRDHSLFVVDGRVTDTLSMMPGTFGKIAPDFDGHLLERRLYNASAVGISRHYPTLDSTLHYGSSSAFRAESVEGETLVHPTDSTAMLLFSDRYSARLQSYDRLLSSYVFQDASSGDLPILEASGFFSGDTLWVVMTAKEGEELYQIRLNAVLPDVRTLSLPHDIDPREVRRLWLR